MTLPNFLIIGAAKSGTTSLHAYIGQHPQAYMSPLKETNFFAFDGERPWFGGPDGDVFMRDSVYRLEQYARLFEGQTDKLAIGETSPRYLSVGGTAARIKRSLPTVKLVAILRNPADRAFSAFSMRKRDGWEPCETLERAIADEPRRIAERWGGGIYRATGLYAQQLRSYYEHFAREQIRVYLYDDLVSAPDQMFADLFGFLGIDPRFRPETSRRLNVSGVIKNPVLRAAWTRTHRVQRIVRPLMPKPIRQRISQFFIGLEKERLPFALERRKRLIDYYRDDVEELQNLIVRELSGWLVG
jgi:hypothetical protein